MQYRILKDTYHNGALCPAGTIVLLDKDPQWPEHFELVAEVGTPDPAQVDAQALVEAQKAVKEAETAMQKQLAEALTANEQAEADAKAAVMVAEAKATEAEARATEAETRALRAEAGEKSALAEVEKLKKKAAKA